DGFSTFNVSRAAAAGERYRSEGPVSTLKLTVRTVLDLLLIIALGAAVYVPAQYYGYRHTIPDAATPNGGHLPLLLSAEALGFRVPALCEREDRITVLRAFTTDPAHFPDNDEALLAWLQSQPGVDGPCVQREMEKEGRKTVRVHYRFPRRAEGLN